MCPLIRKVITVALLVAAVSEIQAAEPPNKTPESLGTKPLDLKAPDVRRLFTESQLQELSNPRLPEVIEEVEVQRRRPSNLIRILGWFLPRPDRPLTARDEQARDATLPYALPVAAPARMAGELAPYDR